MSTYDLDALERAYGPVPVHEKTFDADADAFAEYRTAAREDAIGGARVLVTCDGEALLCRVRDGLDGWDVVGGGREPGETPGETARREVREEVGLDVTLTDAVRASRITFAHGDRTVSGLWVYFRGTSAARSLTVQSSELHEARWVAPDEVPPLLEAGAEPVIRDWADG
ncbi:NUDIX domain-containing protein [Haloarchaeobius sp. HRN-SO-5]|uniref:NUDIX domain-containing protein n=1 Tax=Haloarchaeobius sp. HRN-SO-5 TaxID=3446118 RepID=UPI003EBA14EF